MDKEAAYPEVFTPFERQIAWAKYEEHFGMPYPDSRTYGIYRDDWQAEVADIERRIATNDPA